MWVFFLFSLRTEELRLHNQWPVTAVCYVGINRPHSVSPPPADSDSYQIYSGICSLHSLTPLVSTAAA